MLTVGYKWGSQYEVWSMIEVCRIMLIFIGVFLFQVCTNLITDDSVTKKKNLNYINVWFTADILKRFDNDTMCITIHGWGYHTRTIWAHLEQYAVTWLYN